MAFCRLVFFLLVISIVQCLGTTQVPVFLWGDLATSTLKSNPLSVIDAEKFDVVLKDALREDPYVVVFVEETLSVEDFSRKNSRGETSYSYLHANIGNSLYLPSVINPLFVLRNLADPDAIQHIKLTEHGLSAEPSSLKYLFVHLKDASDGESRADLLRRHNDVMEEMFNKLQTKYNKVVAVYTAHYPSWVVSEAHSRVRRQASNETMPMYIFDNLLLKIRHMKLNVDGKPYHLDSLTGNSTFLNNTELEQSLAFGENTITLNFYSKGGYWFLETIRVTQTAPVNFTKILTANSEVYALIDFSYRCGQEVVFSSKGNGTKGVNITLTDMRIQPFFQTVNASDLVFGDQFDCVGFFSVPIWSGLFVVFILLAITFYGIMMMLDIRTNDRFDDPKGKTITINTAE